MSFDRRVWLLLLAMLAALAGSAAVFWAFALVVLRGIRPQASGIRFQV